MAKRTWVKIAVLTPLALLVVGAAWLWWVFPISDLRVASVERIAASALPADDPVRGALIERGESLWRVTLSGSAGWIGEVGRLTLNTYPIVRRCDDPDKELFTTDVYVDGVRLSPETSESLRTRPAAAEYTIYISEKGQYRSARDFNARLPDYDLEATPAELCIRIAGGAMHGAYGQSNEVRLKLPPG